MVGMRVEGVVWCSCRSLVCVGGGGTKRLISAGIAGRVVLVLVVVMTSFP